MHSWASAARLLSVSNCSFFSAAFHLIYSSWKPFKVLRTAVTKTPFCLPATRLLYSPMGYEVSLELNRCLRGMLCCRCAYVAGNPGYCKVNFTHKWKTQLFWGVLVSYRSLKHFQLEYVHLFIYKVTIKDNI